MLQSPFPNVQFPSAALPYRDQVRLVKKLHTNYRLLEQLGFLQGLYFPNFHSVFLSDVGFLGWLLWQVTPYSNDCRAVVRVPKYSSVRGTFSFLTQLTPLEKADNLLFYLLLPTTFTTHAISCSQVCYLAAIYIFIYTFVPLFHQEKRRDLTRASFTFDDPI